MNFLIFQIFYRFNSVKRKAYDNSFSNDLKFEAIPESKLRESSRFGGYINLQDEKSANKPPLFSLQQKVSQKQYSDVGNLTSVKELTKSSGIH